MYFIITVGAFLPITVRGLIYTYARGFIINLLIINPQAYDVNINPRTVGNGQKCVNCYNEIHQSILSSHRFFRIRNTANT